MPEVTLRDYIWNKHGVDIDLLPIEKPQAPPVIPEVVPLLEDPDLSLPADFIPNIADLVERFQRAPQQLLYKTLDDIASELLQLEDYCEVALRNPGVVEAGQRARVNWQRAEELWKRKRNHLGDMEARRAVSHSLRSLIAAYQHTAGHKIVSARKYIEEHEWLISPTPLLEIHRSARSYFESGRQAQVRPDHDTARAFFKRAILEIRQLYLKGEHLNHLMEPTPNV